MSDQADHIGRLIALVGKIATVSEYPRSMSEIARELLDLAGAHGATFERDVEERLDAAANSRR
jgi:hypothetical protein